MTPSPSIASRVADRDVSLFDAIETELTLHDRRSMLAIQSIVANRRGSYRYLEIGSHKGGSIQPHLLDGRCEAIVSVDPRPLMQRDERGPRFAYPENSTARMLEALAKLAPDQAGKIATFETTAPDLVMRHDRPHLADLCLIDAEHTDRAATLDFEAVLELLREDAVIVLHDAPIIYRAIGHMVEELQRNGRPYAAFPLLDSLFVIVLGRVGVLARPEYNAVADEVGLAYLTALRLNAGYRDFYQLLPFRIGRSILARLGCRACADRYQYGWAGWDKSA